MSRRRHPEPVIYTIAGWHFIYTDFFIQNIKRIGVLMICYRGLVSSVAKCKQIRHSGVDGLVRRISLFSTRTGLLPPANDCQVARRVEMHKTVVKVMVLGVYRRER